MCFLTLITNVVLSVPGSSAAGADTAPAAGEAFRVRLLQAISSGNRRAVATMFRYPARVNVSGFPIPVKDAAALVQMYDLFFTPEMRCAIEQSRSATVGSPAPKYPLTVAGGVMSIGKGLIVAETTPTGLKISRMTVIGQGGRPPRPTSARRMDLRLGGASQQAGRLEGDDNDVYVVSLTGGTQLQANLQGFRGLDLALRVTGPNREPIIDGRRAWNGVIPASGDYTLQVVRNAAFCNPSLTYLLTLRVQ
jgi:hypothetical protein